MGRFPRSYPPPSTACTNRRALADPSDPTRRRELTAPASPPRRIPVAAPRPARRNHRRRPTRDLEADLPLLPIACVLFGNAFYTKGGSARRSPAPHPPSTVVDVAATPSRRRLFLGPAASSPPRPSLCSEQVVAPYGGSSLRR